MRDIGRKAFQNSAIFLLVFIGVKNLLSALPLRFAREFVHLYGLGDQVQAATFHGILSFLTGTLMLLLVWHLYRRVRIAWLVEILVLTASIVMQIIRYHRFTIPIVLIEGFILVVLALSHQDFSRRADRVSMKRALVFIAISFVLLIGNASVGLHMMQAHINDVHTVAKALYNSLRLLVFMDVSALQIKTLSGRLYADSLITLNWICMTASLILLLKPLVYDPIRSKSDRGRVRNITLLHGQNPSSYLALESDKKYFFGSSVEGVCAYTVVGRVMVCCGDMICDLECGFAFLTEVFGFCRMNGYDLLFLNITDAFRDLYQSAGFGIAKYGEDACFKLDEHTLAGGKIAKVRAAVNHAKKAGITTHEYSPNIHREPEIERRIQGISSEWLQEKKSPEMSFMLGSVGLDNPMDRRYFYSVDSEGDMLAFIVFLPYLEKKAWYADVTRRKPGTPQGAMEMILMDVFSVFRSEGADWVNLGLCPLHNVATGDKATLSEHLFAFIYEHMNDAYDFKALYHAKEKYAPTHWETRYLAFHPKPFSPQFAYAIVKSQNPKGISSLLFSGMKPFAFLAGTSSEKTERNATDE